MSSETLDASAEQNAFLFLALGCLSVSRRFFSALRNDEGRPGQLEASPKSADPLLAALGAVSLLVRMERLVAEAATGEAELPRASASIPPFRELKW